jgi:hypothetical protein
LFKEAILTVTLWRDRWKLKLGEKEYLLGPTTIPLVHIVEAIESIYTDILVNIDLTISQNIWFKKHIKMKVGYTEHVFLENISEEFANDIPKQCSRCRRQAWYNSVVKGYQCHHCLAIETSNPGVFSSLKDRMEIDRRSEYFGGNSAFSKTKTPKYWTII